MAWCDHVLVGLLYGTSLWHGVFMFWLDSCMGPTCGKVRRCFGWIALWYLFVALCVDVLVGFLCHLNLLMS